MLHPFLVACVAVLLSLVFAAVTHQSPMTCQQIFADATAQSGQQRAGEGQFFCWGIIGDTGRQNSDLRSAGIQAKVFSLSWRQYMPASEDTDPVYLTRKRTELARLRADGFAVILSLGYHDTPAWVHDAYSNSHYINQHGGEYPESTDAGDLNLVFNPDLRALVERYIATVFDDLGADFLAVRVGGGRYGELTYPTANFEGERNIYWVFDANAGKSNPAPNWRPGDPSPNGEAGKFLEWMLDELVHFQQWQIETVRRSYGGPIMVLYPSWGIRPGDINRAVATNLNGSTPAERNGEIQRGFDFARQVAAIDDAGIIVTTTWLDADASADGRRDPRYWSPVKYLHALATEHPLHLQMYGENTGHGTRADMELSVEQTRRLGLLGMAWFREEELFSGAYASLDDYASLIEPPQGRSLNGFLPLILR